MQERIDFARLARQLMARGHTTKNLGAQIGLSQPSVSRLATGKTTSISADVAVQLIYAAGGRIEVPKFSESTDAG